MKSRNQITLVLATIFTLAAFGPQTQAGASGAKSEPIRMDQIGAVAAKQYSGDGLAVAATPDGARLRCVFQRLQGEATHEGLWLTSTVTNGVNDRFRVVATAVGRRELCWSSSLYPPDGQRTGERGSFIGSLASNDRIHPGLVNERESKRRN